ncbi:MAG: iron-containing alcohol dehydrogenase [Proteobacteria bacterium]|nr:iron-containing alcohol dehydrogenase [Pseudomonadota bacterium]
MTKTLFVTDRKIWQNCQKFFPESFLISNAKNLFLTNPKADEKNLKKISVATTGCDFILALGSGTINDLCKFTSLQKNIPYSIFASAPSMNGYLSKNASITISGHKKTLPATLPEAVFCDMRILKSAPLDLIKAGIGDSLCFYSCWFDWYLSHKLLGTKFSKKPFNLLVERMTFFVQNFRNFSLRDEEFLKLLIEILLLSGEGMTMAGGSYPASQSEHLIAHAIEMKYPKIAEKKLHGEVIAVTTLTSARVQKEILQRPKLRLFISEDWPQKFEQNFFPKEITQQCVAEYRQKQLLKPKKFDWPKLKQELQKIHLDESLLKEIFSHFKIKISPRSLGLSSEQYQECVANAKFIRNRFTCLDL